LDSLLLVCDELAKFDTSMENSVNKLVDTLKSVVDDDPNAVKKDRDWLMRYLVVNDGMQSS
jgi:hypothetical protein